MDLYTQAWPLAALLTLIWPLQALLAAWLTDRRRPWPLVVAQVAGLVAWQTRPAAVWGPAEWWLTANLATGFLAGCGLMLLLHRRSGVTEPLGLRRWATVAWPLLLPVAVANAAVAGLASLLRWALDTGGAPF